MSERLHQVVVRAELQSSDLVGITTPCGQDDYWHIGDPAQIGIKDISSPDFGDPVTIKPGEVPVFWACGVTPQVVAMHSRPELMITHAPGHMFVTDIKEEHLGVL